jgi:hypothetical protein
MSPEFCVSNNRPERSAHSFVDQVAKLLFQSVGSAFLLIFSGRGNVAAQTAFFGNNLLRELVEIIVRRYAFPCRRHQM